MLVSPSIQAAPVVLDDLSVRQQVPLNGHLEVLYDPNGLLTLDDARSPQNQDRYRPVKAAFNGGFSSGAWWLRVAVVNSVSADRTWWLRLGVPYVDYVDVWVPQHQADGSIALRHSAIGGLRPVSARDMHWWMSTVRLDALPRGEPQWIWIRLAGHRTISFSADIQSLDALGREYQQSTFRIAAVIGMTVMMTVVSLLLGISLPDRKFLWYAAYLGSSAFLFFCSENLLSALVMPESPVAAVRLHGFSMCLGLFTALVFARALLEMPERFPRIDRMFQVMAALALAGSGVALAGHYGAIAPLVNVVRLGQSILIVVLCVLLIRQRAPLAWINFIGYGVYATVGVLHFAKNLDLLPYNWVTQYSYLMGVIVHMVAIFLSLGLRVRIRERQALAESQMAGVRLEARVAERTRELQVEIDQRQQAQAQLQKAMQEQRNFLSMVSHEFRTPLSVIGAAVELITDERLAGSRQDVQHEAAKIGRAKQRMLGLVETLLADEWLQSSKIKLHRTQVDLVQLLEEKREEHADASGRDIRFDSGGMDMQINADERLLHIVFDNLIENAIKYAPARSAIELKLDRQPDQAVVTVRDYGPGFDGGDLELVFERFYRADSALKKPGIGLGLYTVRRIAELHGGSVRAGNVAAGGAALTVVLPVFATTAP